MQADDVRESAGDIGHATNPTTSLPAQPDSRQSPSVHAGANALKATAKEASIIAPSPASSTPDGQAPKKDGGDASKPVIKAKKRQVSSALRLWRKVMNGEQIILSAHHSTPMLG